MPRSLSVNRSVSPSGELSVTLGHDLLDDYLTFLAGTPHLRSVTSWFQHCLQAAAPKRSSDGG
jgi:hypothetical protein